MMSLVACSSEWRMSITMMKMMKLTAGQCSERRVCFFRKKELFWPASSSVNEWMASVVCMFE